MNERDYLDRRARDTADNIEAVIESRNDDGTYTVREIASRARHRATAANPVDTFALNARVTITPLSASRSVLGAGAMIISRAPRDQRGLSGSVPVASVQTHERAVIYSVDPDPLELEAGGDPGEQTIIGRGLTGPGVYFGRGDRPDPIVTDDVAPDVEPERVIMNIAADADSPLGLFDVSIGLSHARDALRIVASTRPRPPWIAVLGVATSPNIQVLWVLDPATFAVIASTEFSGTPVPTTQPHGLTSFDGVIYWISGDNATGNTYTLHAFDPGTGIRTDADLSSTTIDFSQQSEMRYFDGKLFICSRNSTTRGLLSFNVDASGLALVWSDSLANSRYGIDVDSSAIYVTSPTGTRRLNRSTYASEATTGTGGVSVRVLRAWAAGVYGAPTGLVCVAGNSSSFANAARWLDSATMGTSATQATGGPHQGPIQINDKVYLVGRGDSTLYEAALDGSTLTNIVTLNLIVAGAGAGIASDGVDILHLRSDETIRRVTTAGATLATSAVLTLPSNPSASVSLTHVAYVEALA